MRVDILNVSIDNLSKNEVLAKIDGFLSDGRQHYIVTPNPEMVMAAQRDKEFLEILNRADLAVPDGVGLIFASRYLRQPLLQRITGADLMFDICKLAEQKNCSVHLLAAAEGLAKPEEVAAALRKRYPQLKISGGIIKIADFRLLSEPALVGEIAGKYPLPSSEFHAIKPSRRPISDLRIIDAINNTKPEILFVALGAGHQEKFIVNNLKNLSSVKIAMGVGGAFDFIAGKVKRAPQWLRKIGLEWLWRLFVQPWRWKRILTATIKFSWKVIKNGKKYA